MPPPPLGSVANGDIGVETVLSADVFHWQLPMPVIMLPLSLALKTGKAQAITVLKEAPSLFVDEISHFSTSRFRR